MRGIELIQAAFEGRLAVVKEMIEERGIGVDAGGYYSDKDQDGRVFGFDHLDVTPLLAASAGGRIDVMKYLASRGADLRATLKDGSNIFTVAEQNNRKNVTDFLSKEGLCQGLYIYSFMEKLDGSSMQFIMIPNPQRVRFAAAAEIIKPEPKDEKSLTEDSTKPITLNCQ